MDSKIVIAITILLNNKTETHIVCIAYLTLFVLHDCIFAICNLCKQIAYSKNTLVLTKNHIKTLN